VVAVSIRLVLFAILLLGNFLAYVALSRGAVRWFAPETHRRASRWILAILLLLNLPLLAFFIPRLDAALSLVSPAWLRVVFYPSAAWLATLAAVMLLASMTGFGWLMWRSAKLLADRIQNRERPGPNASRYGSPRSSGAAVGVARRSLLSGGPGMLVGALYSVSSYGVYAHRNEIDISKEYSIPVPDLPRSMEGMTIVQISDLHVGPYIRESELRHIVNLTNQLHPDLVVITGDVLDRHLSSLPDAVNGLKGIRSELGVFTVLGNHDYYADRYSNARFRGGVRITSGLESIGIHTLRNEVVQLGKAPDQLALLGLDWLTTSPTDRSFYSYKPAATRRQLRRMLDQAGPGTPKILLAHHPDTFEDVPSDIALTLSGHTHGGGQVILGTVGDIPIGIATLRFKYLSGLYQKNGSSLYVNRGIGYLGIPIRINCPPEISRFKLVRPA